jgi:hypothetical protein
MQNRTSILTFEKPGIMNSVLHILRDEGFQVFLIKKTGKARYSQIELPEAENDPMLDSLEIIRFVREKCDRQLTILIECIEPEPEKSMAWIPMDGPFSESHSSFEFHENENRKIG